jgi:subtilisin family serine protease
VRLEPPSTGPGDPSDARSAFDPTRGNVVAIALEFLGADADLRPLGALAAARAGDIVIGWANLDRLEELAAHPATLRVDLLRKPSPSGEVVPNQAETGGFAPAARVGPCRPTGRGVRVAVVDFGFDFLHPAFLRETEGGGEEVRAIWLYDTTLPPRDAGAPIGRRFDRAALQAALDWYRAPVPPADGAVPEAVALHLGRLREDRLEDLGLDQAFRNLLRPHGTAVAGIAAGNGRGGGASGVAPEADLLLIAIGLHDETRFADSPQVAAAFAAAFEEDTAAPCVALMSDSDNLGPHDGSLLGERFLDELLLLPGRAVVLTAGNLNHPQKGKPEDAAWHAEAMAPEDGSRTILTLRFDEGADWPDCAEVWFQAAPGGAPEARVTCRAGAAAPVADATVPENTAWTRLLAPQDNRRGTAADAQLQHDDAAGAHCLRVVFRPAGDASILPAQWTIEVPAVQASEVHGWLDRNNSGRARWEGAPAAAGANRTTLGSPDVAVRSLTVGSVGLGREGGAPGVSDFSGRGPVRGGAPGRQHKPDLVAVGEDVRAPMARPAERLARRSVPANTGLYARGFRGTSYAAPQVAGACALLLERYGSEPIFGPVATWADLRQAVLQTAARPAEWSWPAGDAHGWDAAHGHGLLNLDRMLDPPPPTGADLWIPKAAADTGTEPFVASCFWNSPALLLEDAAGRALDVGMVAAGRQVPVRVRVRVSNRGAAPARHATVALWWAPLGGMHPLPGPEGGGAWRADGIGKAAGAGANRREIAEVAAGDQADVLFPWTPPRVPGGNVLAHCLLAAVDAADDPFDATDALCAQNNAAALCVAAAVDAVLPTFRILGSDDVDGLVLWRDRPEGRLLIEDLPVTALPWRDGAMFLEAGRPDRPLHGAADAYTDPAAAAERLVDLEGKKAVTAVTDVLDAEFLGLRGGRITIRAGPRLVLPRLRIALGAPLDLRVSAPDGAAGGATHLMHLSGGRRVGGGTVRSR